MTMPSREDEIASTEEVTGNGEMFLEVLTAEMLYIDANNKEKNAIGVRYADGLVSFVDALEVKSSVYESTDQFPQQNL